MSCRLFFSSGWVRWLFAPVFSSCWSAAQSIPLICWIFIVLSLSPICHSRYVEFVRRYNYQFRTFWFLQIATRVSCAVSVLKIVSHSGCQTPFLDTQVKVKDIRHCRSSSPLMVNELVWRMLPGGITTGSASLFHRYKHTPKVIIIISSKERFMKFPSCMASWYIVLSRANGAPDFFKSQGQRHPVPRLGGGGGGGQPSAAQHSSKSPTRQQPFIPGPRTPLSPWTSSTWIWDWKEASGFLRRALSSVFFLKTSDASSSLALATLPRSLRRCSSGCASPCGAPGPTSTRRNLLSSRWPLRSTSLGQRAVQGFICDFPTTWNTESLSSFLCEA